MEILSPFEGIDEGDWISPRISFSQDFQLPGRCSPKMQFKDSPEEEFSFIFRNAANVDLPADDSMISADELFFNGKLRPLQGDARVQVGDAFLEDETVGFGRSIEENPRCFSMTIESCRGEARGSRAFMSLNNSRCSSPSRTMSMPRTTPTSPKASLYLPSTSPSSTSKMPSSDVLSGWLLSSSSASPSGMPSSSLMSMSSSVCASSPMPSSKYSSKLKDFFKLKKGNMSKDSAMSSLPCSSTSAEISRESPQTSGSASSRLPSKSFWPFSRSNSAGESKTTPAVSPPPRRSNSAGEGKTTSSSLLPMSGPPSKQPAQCAHKNSPFAATTSVQAKGLLTSSADTASSLNGISKKGLPPLPNSNAKKANSFFVPAHCGADSVALASQSTPVQACSSSHRNMDSTSSIVSNEDEPSHTTPFCKKEGFVLLPDERIPSGDIQDTGDALPVSTRKGRSTAAASPGRPARRGVHGHAARNFARGSPGRRGAWNSPGRGNGGRVSIRHLDRGSISSKGHVRPKDMLNRDGASVRISPVLNVAVPSLRGTKGASKSKIFSLGNLFSKKERVASMRAYTVLTPPDSQDLV